MQRNPPVDADAIRALVDHRPHPPKALRHGGDAVALFDPKLPGAIDGRDALGLCRQGEEYRDLIDGGRHLGGADGDRA